MKDNRRLQKVERGIREAVSSYLINGFRWPLKGFVTVTSVEVSADLRYAKVFVSVLGSLEDQAETLETLQDNVVEIQSEVSRNLKMKFSPKIQMLPDTKGEAVRRVESMIRNLNLSKSDS